MFISAIKGAIKNNFLRAMSRCYLHAVRGESDSSARKGHNTRTQKAYIHFLTHGHSLKLYVRYMCCSSLQIPTSYFPLDLCFVVWQPSLSSVSSSTTSSRWTLCCGSGQHFPSSTQIKVRPHSRCTVTYYSVQCNVKVSSQRILLH